MGDFPKFGHKINNQLFYNLSVSGIYTSSRHATTLEQS